MEEKYGFLAVDIGATSGRAVVGTIANGELEMREVHRFPNHFVCLHGRYFWNVFSLYEEIKKSLAVCKKESIPLRSIGIDTWGIDFGYIGGDGSLLGLPRAYRDPYTEGAAGELFGIIPREEVYRSTGIEIMDCNSLFQLYRAGKQKFAPFMAARRILFMPDLLAYMLTGNMVCEYTIASTSQMLNPATKSFDADLLLRAGIDPSLLTDPVMPGTEVGRLTHALAGELGMEPVPVIAVAGHDTASAVAATPAADASFAYISSGTWSLMGVETKRPVITEASMRHNFTNEGGVEGSIRFQKNITGMWILEECRREWAREGRSYTYPQIVEMAEACGGSPSFLINSDDPAFAHPLSMCEAINGYCRTKSQPLPRTDADVAGLIFRSLANRYREVLAMLREMAPFAVERLHVIGGGSRNSLLNQLTADATGLPVIAGPAEATSIGNIMVQARCAGLVEDRWGIRRMVASAFKPEIFNPRR
ncbi:MAG: rhamnulokinase [Tannerellaceae bacterium]|jgi:rhamnulokinase|nr:rhamnulokinase [Tannerellaceae bacterium]